MTIQSSVFGESPPAHWEEFVMDIGDETDLTTPEVIEVLRDLFVVLAFDRCCSFGTVRTVFWNATRRNRAEMATIIVAATKNARELKAQANEIRAENARHADEKRAATARAIIDLLR